MAKKKFTDLNAFYNEYGNRIEYLEEDDSLEGAFFIIMEYANDFTKIYKQKSKSKKLEVDVCVINNLSFNARAVRHGETSYLIAMHSGMMNFIFETVESNIEFLEKELSALGDINDIIGKSVHYVISCFLGHELGHIIRGHIDLSDHLCSISEIGKIDTSSILNLPTMYKNNDDKLQYLMEVDADLYSGFILGYEVMRWLEKYQIQKHTEPLKELIELAVYSIFLIHNRLMKINKDHSKRYPPTLNRIILITHKMKSIINIATRNKHEKNINGYIDNAIQKITDHLLWEDNLTQDLSTGALSRFVDVGNTINLEHEQFNNFILKHVLIEDSE